jgi:H+/Cl- antiporter ClcA
VLYSSFSALCCGSNKVYVAGMFYESKFFQFLFFLHIDCIIFFDFNFFTPLICANFACGSRLTVAWRRYFIVGGVTLLVSSVMYSELALLPGSNKNAHLVLKHLFSKEDFSKGMVGTMCYFVMYKFVATLLSVTLPLPVGLFTPTFVIGGLLGRILGTVRMHVACSVGHLFLLPNISFSLCVCVFLLPVFFLFSVILACKIFCLRAHDMR